MTPSFRSASRLASSLLPLAMLALAANGALAADPYDSSENPFRYSMSIAPSIMWPRLNELNDSLAYSGNQFTNGAMRAAGANPAGKAAGFREIRFGWGGHIELAREFDEDFRAGILANISFFSTNETINISPLPTATYYSTTEYKVSQSIGIPLLQGGIFFQRMFRFEEEPNLNLYAGGWGTYGLLVAAGIRGFVTNLTNFPDDKLKYKSELGGSGWGAGGVAGAEYLVLPWLALYLETGYEYFIIKTLEVHGDVMGDVWNLSTLKNGNAKDIPLDYSGIFLRLGLRSGIRF